MTVLTGDDGLFDPSLPAIDSFRGPWRFLSNFYPAPLIFEGREYATSEHAFNAAKSLDPQVRAWIAEADSPRAAKKRGNDRRRVTLRPAWDERVRYEVMQEVLRAKFTAKPRRTQALLGTGMRQLVEGTLWHDVHWGVCLCGIHQGAGENHLGRLLMELRADLAAQAR